MSRSDRQPPAPALIRIAARAAPLLLVVQAAIPAPSAAEARDGWRWTAEKIADYARVTSVEISPDGQRVLYLLSRPRGEGDKPGAAYVNIWTIPFRGGTPRRMTSADAEDKSPAWSPDGSRIAFLSARGDEKAKTRLWIMPADGGEATPITGEKIDVTAFDWAPHGRSIAYVASDPAPESKQKEEKAGRDWVLVDKDLRTRRLWIAHVAGTSIGKERAVASAGDRSVWELDWSPDGRSIVATVSDTPRTDDSYIGKRIMILPVEEGSGEAQELVGLVGKVDQVAWSKDGARIGYRAGVDRSDPFSGSLFVIPAGGGAPVNLTGERPESVNRIDWMRDGRLAVVSVAGTGTKLSLFDPQDRTRVRSVAEAGPQVFTSASYSADGRRAAMAASSADSPAEVYSLEMNRGTPSLTRLTHANPDLESLPRGRQEVFKYRASDGLEIESVLIRPVSYPGRDSYPLVVIAHGGPESQYLNGWNTTYSVPGQVLAERGYFVLYPNYRGSTGRGVVFSKADHKELGGREFTDVLDGIDALAEGFPIDLERVGITGGSYGGYFTALGITRHSERFAAGVELFGVTNWMSFLGTSDTPVENSNVHWNLWCYDHPNTCWEASPISHIHNAATPTLILQGEKDERVPKTQSDELYAALRWKRVPVEYIVFPREKHGFRERAHQIETTVRLLDWFDKYLKPTR